MKRNDSGRTKSKYIPLAIIILYYVMSIALFKYGPWNWPVENEFELYLFLFVFLTAIAIGYLLGALAPAQYRGGISREKVNVFLMLFVIIVPLTSFSRIQKFVPSIRVDYLLSNLGKNYYENNLINNNKIIEYFRILISPAIIAAPILVLTSNYKKRIKRIYVLFAFALYSVLIDINRGQNRQIADFIIIVGISMLINGTRSQHDRDKNVRRKSKKNSFKKIFVLVIIIIMFFSIFGSAMEQRNASGRNSYANIELDTNNAFLSFFPTSFSKFAVGMLISYLTQGYYGLSIALNSTFNWTYGFGYSTFLINNIDQLLGTNMVKNAYYSKTVFSGWPTGKTWSTAFVFFASDLTFFGTIVLYFAISYCLAKSWKEAIELKNQVSTIFFSLLVVVLIYTPANNQMFQLGENFFAFWFWLFAWLIYPLIAKSKKTLSCGTGKCLV